MAAAMAIATPRIRADIIDLPEFRELIARYAVQGVPKTVLNDQLFFDGALPEPDVLAAVLEAARGPSKEAAE
jgi:alkyl hydroperoxide reductase subunit AhpF